MEKETMGQILNDSWEDWEDEEPTCENEPWERFLDLLRRGKVYFWE